MTNWTRLLWWALPLALAPGCIQSHRPEVVYVPAPVVPGPPTSDRPATRVYPETPPPTATAPAEPSAQDLAIAGAVRQALQTEPALPDLSHTVEATVQNGLVTLRGSLPSENERTALIERISKLPGVTGVRDQIEVELR